MDTLLYQKAAKEIDAGRRIVIVSKCDLSTSAAPEKQLFTVEELAKAQAPTEAIELAQAALSKGKLQYLRTAQGNILLAEPFFPESQLIILGGGHIAVPLAEFSAKCGFAVTVVDDRPSFANKGRFPLARRVLCERFETCFPLLNINPSTFVVIITRGHRHDLDCLRKVLPLETAYTGMIGSRRRVKGAMAQLAGEGFTNEMLERVHAPIGLSIGAITPEEISISILAQLIAIKRGQGALNWPELDRALLNELGLESQERRALVTIVESKGSTPREAGAKMIVWPHGKIMGSIGGGCSESAVMQTAYDVIRSGICQSVDIDMTGDVAEDEGMVCGGTMKVLIEPC